MKRFLLVVFFLGFLFSCSDDNGITPNPDPDPDPDPSPVSPVVMNLNEVPYQNLSQYNFFDGDIKNLDPVYGVIPYDLINSLFVDYAHKKRFIWMPTGTKAQYVDDFTAFEFPEGAAVIKNFYYDHMQPNDETKLIETRLMIMKNGEWIFADYVWNDDQTEAVLDLSGRNVDIAWTQNGENYSTSYRIPSEEECFTCHKTNEIPALIGPKPQNVNKTYSYADGAMNQIQKWIDFGYLDDANIPENIETVANWEDTSLSLKDRARGFLDINCAHCHTDGAHCDYVPMRFAWKESEDDQNLGICVNSQEFIDGFRYIIQPGVPERSALYERMTTDQTDIMMPIIGRTLLYEEAADLMNEWISSMPETNCE